MKIAKLISIVVFAFASAGLAFAVAPGKVQVASASEGVAFVDAAGVQKQLVAGEVVSGVISVSSPENASARLVLGNGTVITLRPNTKIDIVQFDQNNPAAVEGKDFASFSSEPEATSGSLTTVRLHKGTATFKIAKLLPSSKFTVKTRAGDVFVRGTTFSVTDNGSSISVSTVEGAVSVAPNGRASVAVDAGRAVELPVSGTGAVGVPIYTRVSLDEERAISQDTAADAPAAVVPLAPANTNAAGELDPEVPAWATDGTQPDFGRLDVDSPSSL